MAPEQVLIVDPNESQRGYLKGLLAERNLGACEAANCEEALAILAAQPVTLILTETELPTKSGLFLLRQVKERWPGIEVILTTHNASSYNVLQALRHGAYDFIVRPIDTGEILFNALDRAFGTIHLRQHNAALLRELEEKNKSLSRSMKMLKALNASIERLNTSHEIEDLLLNLVTSAMSVLGAQRGFIALHDKGSEKLAIKASKGIPTELVREASARLPFGFTSEVAKRGKPVVVAGLFPKKLLTLANDLERSGLIAGPGLIAAPLLFKERVIGVVAVSQQKQGLLFGDTERDFLIQLSHHAALALEKAGIIYQLKRKSRS